MTGNNTANDSLNEKIDRVLANIGSRKDDPAEWKTSENNDQDCPVCGGMMYKRVDVPVGHADFGRVVRCDNPIHARERADHWVGVSDLDQGQLKITLDDIKRYHKTDGIEDTEYYLEMVRAYGVDNVKSMGLAVSNVEALEAARSFIAGECNDGSVHEKPRGWFYVWGTNGNAKSIMILALYNQLRLQHNMYGLYIRLPKLLNIIRSAYDEYRDRTTQKVGDFVAMGKEQRIDTIARLPVLVIDEFDFTDDKISVTPFVLEILQDLFDRRYTSAIHDKTVTIFASNGSPDIFPPAISDRIRDNRFYLVRNTAPSRRPFMTWDD